MIFFFKHIKSYFRLQSKSFLNYILFESVLICRVKFFFKFCELQILYRQQSFVIYVILLPNVTKDFKSQITITRWLGIIASFYFNAIYSQLAWVWNIGYQNLRKIIDIFPLTNHKVFGSFSKPLFWYALNDIFPHKLGHFGLCVSVVFLNNHFIGFVNLHLCFNNI